MASFSIEGLIYLIFYRLRRHYFLGWTLTRWLVIALIGLPMLVFAGVIPGGMTIFALSSIFSFGILLIIGFAQRTGYHRFVSDDNFQFDITATQAIPVMEKVPIRASGTFAVGKSQQNFVDESVFYQTFETRERVLMLEVAQSRFLLIAQSPEGDAGWWYGFFMPTQVQKISFGRLKFGLHPQLALQLSAQADTSERVISFTLTSDSPKILAKIWADLKSDGLD